MVLVMNEAVVTVVAGMKVVTAIGDGNGVEDDGDIKDGG